MVLLSCISRCTAPSALSIRLAGRAVVHSGGVSFSSAAKGDEGDRIARDGLRTASTSPNSEVDDGPDESPSGPSMRQRQRPRRRTRRTAVQDGAGEVPSLADFMHRAKVLKQYRSFVRLARFVDGDGGDAVGECRAALEEVRLSYKMGMRKDADALSRNMAYSEGERRLRELEAMVGYSADGRQSNESHYAPSSESYDEDSWINTKDEDDPRGRVGVQWPWEKETAGDEGDGGASR